jgi:hypothetical protein
MKIEQLKEIANAVLYEGYLLYPYRESAIKNRRRWTFGLVYPRIHSEANGGFDPWLMRTECLVRGEAQTRLDIHVRFLHPLVRSDREEAMERELAITNLALEELERPWQVPIDFPGTAGDETEQLPIQGAITLLTTTLDANLFRLSVQIENTTPVPTTLTDQQATRQAFVSTHTLLQVRQGAFISLMDPPEDVQEAAQGCQNSRTWPVLVGEEDASDAMLSSPIILYDYPRIAPESAGPLFDGTEIDELLTLRIMTLTDEEKEQMRQGDRHVRAILERTESLSPEQFARLHGTLRDMRPVQEGGEA